MNSRLNNFVLGVLLFCNVLSMSLALYRYEVSPRIWLNLCGCVMFGVWLNEAD